MNPDSDPDLILLDVRARLVRVESCRALPCRILLYHACGLGPFLSEQPIYIFELQALGLGEEDVYDGDPRRCRVKRKLAPPSSFVFHKEQTYHSKRQR